MHSNKMNMKNIHHEEWRQRQTEREKKKINEKKKNKKLCTSAWIKKILFSQPMKYDCEICLKKFGASSFGILIFFEISTNQSSLISYVVRENRKNCFIFLLFLNANHFPFENCQICDIFFNSAFQSTKLLIMQKIRREKKIREMSWWTEIIKAQIALNE